VQRLAAGVELEGNESMNRLSLLAIAVLAVSCANAPPPPEDAPFAVDGDVVAFRRTPAAASLLAVEPVTGGRDGRVRLTGRLVWDEDATVRIFAPVSGRVIRIEADLGARVGARSCLATLASPDFGQAQADAARAVADLTAAQRTVDRLQQLYERRAVPRKDLEAAQADLDRAHAESERTRARLARWGGAPAGRVDEEFPLTSPVSGVVVERNLNPGQEVRSDATTPLFVVSDPRRLWVLLDVTERDLSDVVPGATLEVHTPAYPERTFRGTLDRVGLNLDPVTRTIPARGRLENPDALLKDEMYVTIDVVEPASRPALALPARAVIEDEGRRYVFVEERPGRYRRTAVSLGPEREGSMPVVDGVTAASRVVTEGNLLLEAAWVDGRKS
jgi:membrane fusion protein, heavy metal efflux system